MLLKIGQPQWGYSNLCHLKWLRTSKQSRSAMGCSEMGLGSITTAGPWLRLLLPTCLPTVSPDVCLPLILESLSLPPPQHPHVPRPIASAELGRCKPTLLGRPVQFLHRPPLLSQSCKVLYEMVAVRQDWHKSLAPAQGAFGILPTVSEYHGKG